MIMSVSGSIYFLGKYRPAYFEAKNINELIDKMCMSVLKVEGDVTWLYDRIEECATRINSIHYTSMSMEHGCRGISMTNHPHDRFLDDIIALMLPCPGLDYSFTVNEERHGL